MQINRLTIHLQLMAEYHDLHQLGKKTIKERFDAIGKFLIEYYAHYSCDASDHCKLKRTFMGITMCTGEKPYTIDLKRYYDTCEVDGTYRDFHADLKLSSSEHPEREPIFIEIAVTQDCEKEKIDSGIRIIELKIKEEADIHQPLCESPDIHFYNFKRQFEANCKIERFSLVRENGMLRAKTEYELDCKQKDHHHENAVFDLVIPSYTMTRKRLKFEELGMIQAYLHGVPIKHCSMCPLYSEFHSNPRGEFKVSLSFNEDLYKLANVCDKFTIDPKKRLATLTFLNNTGTYTWVKAEEGKG